jgi:tRNA dimethylallyltransferase
VQLAVELATRFRGEIINADAMQLYDGLPIITNKIAIPERRGVAHHLLGDISLHEMPWTVEDFKAHALKTIQEIRQRGNLPILVGGTQYYVDPLLFQEVTLDKVEDIDSIRTFPILEEPTEVILAELRRVDPVMASRWHPKDRRKIHRSLEIYLRTGKPASQFYTEQQERKAASAQDAAQQTPWENLLFWVYSEREVLMARLDGRVDKMLQNGLLDEVRKLFAFKRECEAAGEIVDMSRGIWQSIGYRQFEPYLTALGEGQPEADVERLKAAAIEDMKVATRRYANYQNRWTRLKQLPRLAESGPEALDSLYLMDSSDVARFADAVVEPAAALTAQFLAGEPRAHPTALSPLAADVLSKVREPPPAQTPCERTCELCGTSVTTEEMWAKHVNGSSHRRAMKKKKKLALVPAVDSREQIKARKSSDGERSDPDLSAMFLM